MRNPCAGCPDFGNYDSRTCQQCEDRAAYVTAIGGMTCSMPVALTDLGGRRGLRESDMGEPIAKEEKNTTDGGGLLARCDRCRETKEIKKFRRVRGGGRAKTCDDCRNVAIKAAFARRREEKKKAALEKLVEPTPKAQKALDDLGIRVRPAAAEDSYEGLALPPGHMPDPLLADLFIDNELTLQRLHWLAYYQRRTPRDQIFAMVEQATPEWNPNKHNQKMREVIYGS